MPDSVSQEVAQERGFPMVGAEVAEAHGRNDGSKGHAKK